MLPPVLAAVILIVVLTKWSQWRPAFLEPSRNVVCRMQNGAWQKLPPVPGEVELLRVSARGRRWATIWHGGDHALARLDGASWQVYTAADFGTRGLNTRNGFVVDGEDVWAGR